MTAVAKGTFTVTMKSQTEPVTADGVSLGRMSLDKRHVGPPDDVVLLALPDWSFDRVLDPATGFAELVVARRGARNG